MRWFEIATPVVKKYESFSAKPYLCPAGRWTIGYGTTRYPNGVKVGPNDATITEAQASAYLTFSLSRVGIEIQRLLKRKATEHQLAAMAILCYNIGVGAHDGVKGDFADSTLLEKFNAGNLKGAADEFPKWNKARVQGQLVPLVGLTKRRGEERAIFQTPD